ncbi:putative baseplate assembly protein [Marinobacter sp. X15-166B]|uniref:putative baseplate assembly protein n=1 Tax=Marinobacter sp. X15-166B TaxID=1897620 RepID=UPI00085C591F|nr:putative baseplate assembly protein [Marinobacter sp. X15-166B]OEY66762.1 putative baseplate assembly protein [Marinobacter sp. X15-166B]
MKRILCQNEQRREGVRQHQQLNGLDYLEVEADQRRLTVYFLGKAPVELEPAQVLIEGGRRIRDIGVEQVKVHHFDSAELDDFMQVTVDQTGDFSTYTLRIAERDAQGQWQPHSAFDPRYDRVEFSFKTDCPSDLDCKQPLVCPPEPVVEPEINYLAKDYGSFRQLMLDRLALVMPDWQERHVPDIGIALVEVLAYVGDHLSYYQDAVATEAYLATARQRISVRRHARLVDYHLHEGCNARAWLCVATDSKLTLDPQQIYFITGINEGAAAADRVLPESDLAQMDAGSYEVFEPMGQQPIQLYPDNSRITFYSWGDRECCLPKGSTRATLKGELVSQAPPQPPDCEWDNNPDKTSDTDVEAAESTTPQLHLQTGDVLLFEEVIGPETGHPGDANPSHRHAVRLTSVEAGVDPLNDNTPVVHIEWAGDDALPFPLCLSVLGPPPECTVIDEVSIACGNVILVDHGHSREQDLGTVPVKDALECCTSEGVLADQTLIPGLFRPRLDAAPLTFSQPLAPDTPASKILQQEVRQALPQVALTSVRAEAEPSFWTAQSDLLGSGPDDQHFVTELDDHGRAHLRFGDDTCGEQPDAGLSFHSHYRVGNGLAGNVGAGTIRHLVLRNGQLSGVTLTLRNPMPAQGGTAPEPISEVKLFAPRAFRTDLQRAITADDYVALVEREFSAQVQRAAAKLRWNGSWYEVLVAVDPYGQEQADAELLAAISKRLHRYRRMGHDLVVKSARRVPLDIEMLICVLPNYLRGHVKATLLDLLSNRTLVDGRPGFFHPDNLSFGEGVYLSKLVAVAQGVEGVESVQIRRLQRLHEPANHEIEQGVLALEAVEIARLDNDPGFPENGLLTLDMRGGR